VSVERLIQLRFIPELRDFNRHADRGNRVNNAVWIHRMMVGTAERENSSHHVDRSNGMGMAQSHIVMMDTTTVHNTNGMAQTHIVMMDTTKIHNVVVGTARIPYMVGTAKIYASGVE